MSTRKNLIPRNDSSKITFGNFVDEVAESFTRVGKRDDYWEGYSKGKRAQKVLTGKAEARLHALESIIEGKGIDPKVLEKLAIYAERQRVRANNAKKQLAKYKERLETIGTELTALRKKVTRGLK
jgi:hypothetical protein